MNGSRVSWAAAAVFVTLIAFASAPAAQHVVRDPRQFHGRELHALAYDGLRQRLVCVGGIEASLRTSPQIAEHDGRGWSLCVASLSPRSGAAMVYDAGRKRLVLFGGNLQATRSAETFEFDGVRWALVSTNTSPSPREGHAMTYDSARGRVVLFGGGTRRSGDAQTWEWDGVDWRLLATAGPPARANARLAYDARRQRSVLFGGLGSGFLNDTWEWDGSVWRRIAAASSPGGRAEHAMVYDAVRDKVVLFGGWNGNLSDVLADTWEYDGTLWTRRNPALAPPARKAHAMVFDAARGQAVLYGGDLGSARVGDLWSFDGSTWTLRDEVAAPSGLLGFDERIGGPVVLGEHGAATAVWVWRRGWQRLPLSAQPRLPRVGILVYDSARARLLLLAEGQNGAPSCETWLFDGATWLRHAGASPPSRSSPGLAYDPIRQRVVMFGGSAGQYAFRDTWEWDGSQWQTMSSLHVPPLARSLAYDPSRNVVLAVGVGPYTPWATWAWDGTDWLQIPSAHRPPDGWLNLVTDTRRGRVIAFVDDQIWEWNGLDWAKQPVGFAALYGTAAVFDPVSGDTLLFHPYTWLMPGGALLYGPATLAQTRPLGSGCAGSNGVPELASGLPYFGNPAFRIDLARARPRAALAFGVALQSQPLGLGGGCTFYLAGPSVVLPAATSPSGFASLALSLPDVAALRGSALYVQAVVADPQGSFAGLALSAGLCLTVGD